MSLDLFPLSPADLGSTYEHVDPDGDVFAVPADEQPVVLDDEAYDRDES